MRSSLVAALAVTALAVAGCGGSDDEGLPVRLVNQSAWDARVAGCPPCGERGAVVTGDPDLKPGEGGTYFGWTETRPWPVTYEVVVRGVESVCPFIDPEAARAEGEVGTRDVVYLVNKKGKCVAGPASMDDL
ncbi:hypothetical protein [Streptomyces sp. NPDC059597]|uniref:hypothetical protein n=1 Tax=Streptomyces sp. NPDC059597 TaxID=3346879 RepID=UPI0036A2678C